jgi:glycosyltransferase involved in cell wall biosynthesis
MLKRGSREREMFVTPRISVILPVYNGQAWLEPCIRSVLSQTLSDFELLVGDDLSTDRSCEIVRGFNRDLRVHTFLFEQNAGLFCNLNKLLVKAQAPIVRFLCQDDILEASCLAHEVEYFESNPDVIMSVCRAHVIDDQNRVIGDWGPDEHPNVMKPQQCLQMLLYYGCFPGNLSTVAARRHCIEQSGGFDESFRVAGDYEMWVRLCQLGNVADLRKKLVRVRDHPGRLSKSAYAGVQFVDENRRITENILRLLPEGTRRRAVSYRYWRQNVLDAHHFVRNLIAGRFSDCLGLMKIIGFRDLAIGILLWLLTVNNHLYRPRPVFYQ